MERQQRTLEKVDFYPAAGPTSHPTNQSFLKQRAPEPGVSTGDEKMMRISSLLCLSEAAEAEERRILQEDRDIEEQQGRYQQQRFYDQDEHWPSQQQTSTTGHFQSASGYYPNLTQSHHGSTASTSLIHAAAAASAPSSTTYHQQQHQARKRKLPSFGVPSHEFDVPPNFRHRPRQYLPQPQHRQQHYYSANNVSQQPSYHGHRHPYYDIYHQSHGPPTSASCSSCMQYNGHHNQMPYQVSQSAPELTTVPGVYTPQAIMGSPHAFGQLLPRHSPQIQFQPAPTYERRGKWTFEEELFAAKMIQYFLDGRLPITPGMTLRSYLADKLRCDPMRVSKKLAAPEIAGFKFPKKVGKRVYRQRAGEKEIADAQKELAELEKKFIDAEQYNPENFSKSAFTALPPPAKRPCNKSVASPVLSVASLNYNQQDDSPRLIGRNPEAAASFIGSNTTAPCISPHLLSSRSQFTQKSRSMSGNIQEENFQPMAAFHPKDGKDRELRNVAMTVSS